MLLVGAKHAGCSMIMMLAKNTNIYIYKIIIYIYYTICKHVCQNMSFPSFTLLSPWLMPSQDKMNPAALWLLILMLTIECCETPGKQTFSAWTDLNYLNVIWSRTIQLEQWSHGPSSCGLDCLCEFSSTNLVPVINMYIYIYISTYLI